MGAFGALFLDKEGIVIPLGNNNSPTRNPTKE
jgi:hypothetical protein